MEILEIDSIGELPNVADKIISRLGVLPVVAFYGDMGAGKTTLIREICHRLGVEEEVTSPTFALINEYRTNRGSALFHFDFYRIENLQEAVAIGAHEYIDSGEICLIEWPENIEALLPEQFLRVEIITDPEQHQKRTFRII